jgi:hypothetical protein
MDRELRDLGHDESARQITPEKPVQMNRNVDADRYMTN